MGLRRRRALVVAVLAVGLAAPTPTRVNAATDPFALSVDVSGANGAGRITTPGRPCVDGGDGAYWHYDYAAPLAGGTFGNDPGDLRFHLDLHSDKVTAAQPGVPQATSGPTAFLLGSESHASIVTPRGTVKVRLQAGNCAQPTLAFDGTTASGTGTWVLGPTAGAYRGATASGALTFNLVKADVAPGADNAFRLQLQGAIDVLKPSLKVEVLGTYWGFLGVDYALRRVTVIYRITNTGPGDAFGVKLTSAASTTNGVTGLGPVPQKLGDLLTGESETVRARYQFGLTQPCSAVILSCSFSTTLGVLMPDALDRPTTLTATTAAKAPTLPPPL